MLQTSIKSRGPTPRFDRAGLMRLPPPLVTGCRGGMVSRTSPLTGRAAALPEERCPSKQVAASKNYYQEHRQNANGSVTTVGPALFLQLMRAVPPTKIIFWHSLVTCIQLLKLLDL
jgi:hypothetical protein